jgi:DNA-directed RNA polymerase subunit RPC12/RpoP
MGFLEMNEAKDAGLLPEDWQPDEELRRRFPHEDPEVRRRNRLRNEAACRHLARVGAVCPHCGNPDGNRHVQSLLLDHYFICSRCGRSFRPDALPTRTPDIP